MEDVRDCIMRRVLWVVVACLLIALTITNLGQFITIRVVVQNHQAQLVQIQQQVMARDRQVQQFVGQLKAAKTLTEVKEVLKTIQ